MFGVKYTLKVNDVELPVHEAELKIPGTKDPNHARGKILLDFPVKFTPGAKAAFMCGETELLTFAIDHLEWRGSTTTVRFSDPPRDD